MNWGIIELEKEVENWLDTLSNADAGKVKRNICRLEEVGNLLPYPFSSQLEGKLRELRFRLKDGDFRITYYIASERRIILLTVFRKTKRNEHREVARAIRTMNNQTKEK